MYVHNLAAGVPAYFPRWSFRGATNNACLASIIVPRRGKRSRGEGFRLSLGLANFCSAFPANETRASVSKMVATFRLFYIFLTKCWKSRWNGKREFPRGWERRLKKDREKEIKTKSRISEINQQRETKKTRKREWNGGLKVQRVRMKLPKVSKKRV